MLINKHTCNCDNQQRMSLLISNICPSRVNTYATKLDRHVDNLMSTDWERDLSGKLQSVLNITIIATIKAVLDASLYRNLNVMLRR